MSHCHSFRVPLTAANKHPFEVIGKMTNDFDVISRQSWLAEVTSIVMLMHVVHLLRRLPLEK